MAKTMDELVNFSKQYGFIFQGSEIYGGLANSWDYGPLGRELKNNIKNAWWKKFIQENNHVDYRNYGLDSAILMNPEVWVASGHVASFADPLIDCKKCKSRERADKLIEEFTKGKSITFTSEVGQHQLWAVQNISQNKDRRILVSGGSGTMGFGFPAAIGVAVAKSENPVVCITGDGSFQMGLHELATCADYHLNIKIMIY